MPYMSLYKKGDMQRLSLRDGDDMGIYPKEEDYTGGVMLSIKDTETDDVLACWGVYPVGPFHGELWAFVSDKIRGHGLWLVKSVRQYIDDLIDSGYYHRLESIVRADSPEYIRFSKLLGLNPVGKYREDEYLFIEFERVKENG